MKTKDISVQYGLDQLQFENWLRDISSVPHKTSLLGGRSLEDGVNVDEVVSQFQNFLQDKAQKIQHENEQIMLAENERLERIEQKQQAMIRIMMTTGFNFEGFKIKKYSGYISGDDAIQIDRGSDRLFASVAVVDVGDSLMQSLAIIRHNALNELRSAAYDLGCNAIIGVDFDYLTLDPETANASGGTLYLPYVFGVTANGTAVLVEEI